MAVVISVVFLNSFFLSYLSAFLAPVTSWLWGKGAGWDRNIFVEVEWDGSENLLPCRPLLYVCLTLYFILS